MDKNTAILIVNVQNDFFPGGALQIPAGDRVLEPINRLAANFRSSGIPILASRYWHSPDSRFFRDYGGIWPVHCVRGTSGAEFHEQLKLPERTVVLSKGIDTEFDGYSAYEGITNDGRSMAQLLNELEIQKIIVCGLATDYCVMKTVLEAVQNCYRVTVMTDAVAGLNIEPGESSRALIKMELAGAQLDTVDGFLTRNREFVTEDMHHAEISSNIMHGSPDYSSDMFCNDL